MGHGTMEPPIRFSRVLSAEYCIVSIVDTIQPSSFLCVLIIYHSKFTLYIHCLGCQWKWKCFVAFHYYTTTGIPIWDQHSLTEVDSNYSNDVSRSTEVSGPVHDHTQFERGSVAERGSPILDRVQSEEVNSPIQDQAQCDGGWRSARSSLTEASSTIQSRLRLQ